MARRGLADPYAAAQHTPSVPDPPDPIPKFGDCRRMRIGLLGGSFNPAHEGHRHVAELAMRRLRLDQVWLLVSPGNPLKPTAGMAPFADRLASAARIADGRRVLASGTEAAEVLACRSTVITTRSGDSPSFFPIA